nr:MAG TPA: hypothetical protein [Caudoviricetes sp.]
MIRYRDLIIHFILYKKRRYTNYGIPSLFFKILPESL